MNRKTRGHNNFHCPGCGQPVKHRTLCPLCQQHPGNRFLSDIHTMQNRRRV